MSGRGIVERVLVTGTLELVTPAHLGNGDAEALTDMPLLLDPLEGVPLLTGTSIAGALRAYLREVELGYGAKETEQSLSRLLFGAVEGKSSLQSWLIVDDALGEGPGFELRDGVAIDPQTRTAEDRKKFDIELLQAGTRFPLRFELLLPAGEDRALLLGALATALHGLETGEIRLGVRKRRGLGQCRVQQWQVCRYRMDRPDELVAWLREDESHAETRNDIAQLLRVPLPRPDARRWFEIQGTCGLDGSLLVRSAGKDANAPDSVQQRSRREGGEVPVVPGSSLAGALRARALRIAKTIHPERGEDPVNEMFGLRIESPDDKPEGSRVLVEESAIRGASEWVQQRVKIDRFTGGAYPQALFAEQPLFEAPETELDLRLRLRNPQDHEVGLLLLVLKDLWTGDLTLGGERSVGRGRLAGKTASLCLHEQGQDTWSIALSQAEDGTLTWTPDGAGQTLERYVAALQHWTPGRNDG